MNLTSHILVESSIIGITLTSNMTSRFQLRAVDYYYNMRRNVDKSVKWVQEVACPILVAFKRKWCENIIVVVTSIFSFMQEKIGLNLVQGERDFFMQITCLCEIKRAKMDSHLWERRKILLENTRICRLKCCESVKSILH